MHPKMPERDRPISVEVVSVEAMAATKAAMIDWPLRVSGAWLAMFVLGNFFVKRLVVYRPIGDCSKEGQSVVKSLVKDSRRARRRT